MKKFAAIAIAVSMFALAMEQPVVIDEPVSPKPDENDETEEPALSDKAAGQ